MICQSVYHTSEPCKNSWSDQHAVWVEDSGGPKEPCIWIRWGVQIPMGRGNFGDRGTHWKVQGLSAISCAKTAEPIDLPFGLWTWVARRMHKFNCICQMAPICPMTHSVVSCAKTAEPIDLSFGLWTREGWTKHKFNRIRQVAPPGEYDWNVCLRWRYGLMSNYFDHLLNMPSANINKWINLASLINIHNYYCWFLLNSPIFCAPQGLSETHRDLLRKPLESPHSKSYRPLYHKELNKQPSSNSVLCTFGAALSQIQNAYVT